MPRPCKKRCIAETPKCRCFFPADGRENKLAIKLSVEEYEVIRLMDYENLTQAQCAQKIDVGRTTVQGIYRCARKKMADFIVNALPLEIEGSHYRLTMEFDEKSKTYPRMTRGGNIMTRVAVTYENGEIFQHFGYTESFKIYDIEGAEVKESMVINTDGQGHGALGVFLQGNNVDAIICGGIGGGALQALDNAGIKIYAGVKGGADDAIEKLIKGELIYQEEANCSHHDNSHGCHEHSCHSEGHCGDHHHHEEGHCGNKCHE